MREVLRLFLLSRSSSVMGIALSADNMFTLFLFYEALTVSTYPLVAHKGTSAAAIKRRADVSGNPDRHLDRAAT